MMRLPAFLADRRGASAAEFAMVLPVMLLFLFGTIDAGRYAWSLNQLEKGVQSAVRYAVVTDIVPSGLNAYDPIGFGCPGGSLEASDRICAEALGTISCSGSGGVSCSCTASPCPGLGSANGEAFANIAARVTRMAPTVEASNVSVTYAGSGLGFAGDPTVDDAGNPLSDISPLVTVEVAGVEFRPFILLGAPIDMPPVRSSLTLEDGDGAIGY